MHCRDYRRKAHKQPSRKKTFSSWRSQLRCFEEIKSLSLKNELEEDNVEGRDSFTSYFPAVLTLADRIQNSESKLQGLFKVIWTQTLECEFQ